MIKTNNTKDLNIFNHNFLYTAYADDTTFFIKHINSATDIIKTFDSFSLFSDLNINKTKCEIAGICVLKGVKLALCGMKCVNLNDVIKIFGICYSYDKKLENGKNVHIIKHIILNHIIKL